MSFGHGWNPLWPLAVVALLVLLYSARRRIGAGPLALAAIFCVTLGPALGFVDFYPMKFSFVADHFQYLASAAPIAGAAWLVARWRARRLARGGSSVGGAEIVAVAAILALSMATWSRAHVYRDESTLWQDTLAKNPDAWLAHINLGLIDIKEGRPDAAEHHFEEAVRLKPDEALAHSDLGVVRASQGRLDEAVAEARRAIELDPTLLDAHFNLGYALEKQGHLQDAVDQYIAVVSVKPSHRPAAARLRALLNWKAQGPKAP